MARPWALRSRPRLGAEPLLAFPTAVSAFARLGILTRWAKAGQRCSLEVMERETGIEPATFSLGRRQSIGNKEHSVSCISFWRLRIPAFQSFLCTRIKRSTNGAHESSRDTSRAFTFSTPLWFPLSSTAIASSALMLIAARLRHVAATKWGTKRYLQMNRSNKTVGPHLGRGAANGSMKFSS